MFIVLILDCRKEFIKRCLALNLEETTINQYEKVLKRFISFCNEKEIKEIDKVDASLLRDHIYGLSKTMQPISIKIHYMALKVFFNFLKNNEKISNNPILKVETPKISKKIIPAFSNNEIRTILNCFNKDEFLGYRNYTLTCILFGTGIRRSELVNLLIDDIYFELDIINILGKGDKQRHVPLTQTLKKIIIRYLEKRLEYVKEHKLISCRYLIISNRGQKLNIATVNDIYARIAENEHIKGVRVSPHTWRHTFAKNALLNGMDLFTLGRILGHSSIEVTKKYINLNDNEIKIQNDRFNPFENQKWRYF